MIRTLGRAVVYASWREIQRAIQHWPTPTEAEERPKKGLHGPSRDNTTAATSFLGRDAAEIFACSSAQSSNLFRNRHFWSVVSICTPVSLLVCSNLLPSIYPAPFPHARLFVVFSLSTKAFQVRVRAAVNSGARRAHAEVVPCTTLHAAET